MTPVGPYQAVKTVETVFLYVFRIAFTASLFVDKPKQSYLGKSFGKGEKAVSW